MAVETAKLTTTGTSERKPRSLPCLLATTFASIEIVALKALEIKSVPASVGL